MEAFQTITLFSSVKTDLLRKKLFNGSAIALIGALILVFGGALLKPSSLSTWGLPLFLLGIGLIGLGMLPYRRLKRLESDPYVIKMMSGILTLSRSNKELAKLKIEEIQSVNYVDGEERYGIEVKYKDPTRKNLFFPYFTKISLNEIKDQIE